MSLEVVDEELRIFPKERMIPEIKPKTFILFPYELNFKMRESFEIKEAETITLIKLHLQKFKKAYVASSHGKDSIVMVHLIWRCCKELKIPMIEVWLNNTLNIYKEEKPYWDLFNKWLGIEDKFRVFTPPGNQTVWSIAKKVGHLPNFRATAQHIKNSFIRTNVPECCNILKKQSIKEFLKGLPMDERYDLHFVGTRAEESRIRSLGVLQRCRSYEIKTRFPYPIRVLTPLSYWRAVDVLEYFHRYNIPKNPTYAVHNIKRMGCASCPAYKGWEINMANDPTAQGFGMLKKNLSILKDTESERFTVSIKVLQKYLKNKKSKELSNDNRTRLIELLQGFDNRVLITDFGTVR